MDEATLFILTLFVAILLLTAMVAVLGGAGFLLWLFGGLTWLGWATSKKYK
jgi:nitrate reductase NapE component